MNHSIRKIGKFHVYYLNRLGKSSFIIRFINRFSILLEFFYSF
jgi:hypothetical protein